jgi:hypothetical protein
MPRPPYRKEDDQAIVPFPLSPISNMEVGPKPVKRKQRVAYKMVAEEMETQAKRHGMTRADFLRTAAATTTALMVLNKIHGYDAWGDNAVLPMKKEHCEDLEGGQERLEKDKFFVVDVQTHHAHAPFAPPQTYCFLRFGSYDANLGRFVRRNEAGVACEDTRQLLSQVNYIKEMLIDSETEVAVVSGLPSGFPLAPAKMAETAGLANEMAASERCLFQAMVDPHPALKGGPTGLNAFQAQVEAGARAVKTYTYNGDLGGGWRLDNPAISYPMLQMATDLGMTLINTHKGLPLAALLQNSPQDVRTLDMAQAIRDWPNLKFCAYHSGFFDKGDHPEGLDAGWHPENEPEIAGRNGNIEFLNMSKTLTRKERKRLYAEIGTTFASLITSDDGPIQAAHFIGQLLKHLGPKNILWGTDSIWWGSPQWVIDAFKALQIPASLRKQYGYPKLTKKAKRRILGLNAAKLYGIKRRDRKNLCTISPDKFQQLQMAQGGHRTNRSLWVYGPRTRREFLALLRRDAMFDALARKV